MERGFEWLNDRNIYTPLSVSRPCANHGEPKHLGFEGVRPTLIYISKKYFYSRECSFHELSENTRVKMVHRYPGEMIRKGFDGGVLRTLGFMVGHGHWWK